MKCNIIKQKTDVVKIFINKDGKEIGRAYLYIIKNDLHDRPYGLLEDVFMDESSRGKGFGTQLIEEAIKQAQDLKCYKLVATSRYAREKAHKLYKRLGFENYGIEFRKDF